MNLVMSSVRWTDPGHTATWTMEPVAYMAVRANGIQFSQQLRPVSRTPL